jgi:hypothetical protein
VAWEEWVVWEEWAGWVEWAEWTISVATISDRGMNKLFQSSAANRNKALIASGVQSGRILLRHRSYSDNQVIKVTALNEFSR